MSSDIEIAEQKIYNLGEQCSTIEDNILKLQKQYEDLTSKMIHLASRMDRVEESQDLTIEMTGALTTEVNNFRATMERVNRYLEECCGVSQEAKEAIERDRPAIDQRVLADES